MKLSEQLDTLRRRLTETTSLTADEETALMKATQIAVRLERAQDFSVTNVVSVTTGQGLLDVVWLDMVTQIEPVKAREIAWILLEGAAATETEAGLVRFLKARINLDDQRAGAILQDFRRYRDQPESSLVGSSKPQ